MSRQHIALTLLSAMLATTSVACRTVNPNASPDAGIADEGDVDDRIALVVRNDNFADMRVYAIGGSMPIRIGTVTGNTSQTFRLRPTLYHMGGDLRIIATPIGGRGSASTGQIFVSRGQTILFNVAPSLNQSWVALR